MSSFGWYSIPAVYDTPSKLSRRLAEHCAGAKGWIVGLEKVTSVPAPVVANRQLTVPVDRT
jgi:hypothetical protein